QLSGRMDDLEAKINILKNKDSEELIARQFDQTALRIDGIEDKINAFSENVTTLTQDRYYKVRRGEHLTGIAQKHGLTVKELCALNNINPKQKIYPGQRLVIRSPLMK
ncbi:MAG: LysM domain-containing protein, partial [Thermodesulfobacteriota bacterium]|nr:LysM domain-containing protein [Thermodesulfobacteriota bacterium]